MCKPHFIINEMKSLLYLHLRILPVKSQSPDPGLSVGNEEWEDFVISGFA